MEVYPRNNRTIGAPAEPIEEDDRKTRAVGCVRVEREETRHFSRRAERRGSLGASRKSWVSRRLVPVSKACWDSQSGAYALL